jgi:CRISPR system Cascade subunit CasD
MATLLLRLVGPLQSWGVSSRFGERDTGSEPSKSGVLGLLAAALGRDRTADISDLCALTMGVRCDRPGMLIRDYHTALDVLSADGKKRDTVLSNRYYLSGAAFWVGLEGEDAVVAACHAALRVPKWPLFLGRKACPPSVPLYDPQGMVELPVVEALAQCRFLGDGVPQGAVRAVIEDVNGRLQRPDQPLGPFSLRRFGNRAVREEFLTCT